MKKFVRWMNGTVIMCEPLHVEGENDPYIFSFFSDVANQSEVIELEKQINSNIKTVLTLTQRSLMRWRKFRGILSADKVRLIQIYSLRDLVLHF